MIALRAATLPFLVIASLSVGGCANLFASQSMMALVTLSHHLGLMWVAMEATTLVSSPSIYFNHNPRSLVAHVMLGDALADAGRCADMDKEFAALTKAPAIEEAHAKAKERCAQVHAHDKKPGAKAPPKATK